MEKQIQIKDFQQNYLHSCNTYWKREHVAEHRSLLSKYTQREAWPGSCMTLRILRIIVRKKESKYESKLLCVNAQSPSPSPPCPQYVILKIRT